jgi:4-diphosphocytidyl-2-C-methyl-D-erythritol kinase
MTHQVSIQAPAKLNLGLEVVGRRSDGFHDVVTIFQAITIYDDLTLSSSPTISVISSEPALDAENNLVTVALTQLRQTEATDQGARVTLTKRIPVAAGLGGASTDSAAALVAGRALWQATISDQRLRELARTLGSDVPFCLSAGTALGTGRGDQITPLSPLTDVWFVVVSPAVVIPRKTPTLYGLLNADDFSSGDAVRRCANHLQSAGDDGTISLPPNAFSRPLYVLRPELAALPERMAAAGATAIGLSGAGPTHYAICFEPSDAAEIANRLRSDLGASASVAVATPVIKPPRPVSTYQRQGRREHPPGM